MKYQIKDTKEYKIIKGDDFNHVFRKSDGYTMTWGATKEEDPDYSPVGALLMDIEVTSACSGIRDKTGNRTPCPFCYKSNNSNGHSMNFEDFKNIIDKVNCNNQLDQVALGADASCTSNPDIFKMMLYCREIGIVPNITVADIGTEVAQLLSTMCGAVAVSVYSWNKDAAYDSIDLLANKYKMGQVNIHMLVSAETESFIFNELLKDIKTDPRLKNLNAIVFLSLKKKGRGKTYNRMNDKSYKKLVDTLLKEGIDFGLDSCSAFRFLTAVKDHPRYDEFEQMSQSCESLRESCYINEKGIFTVCSFCEGQDDLFEIDILKVKDFMKEVWYNKDVVDVRNKIIECKNCSKSCFYFDV